MSSPEESKVIEDIPVEQAQEGENTEVENLEATEKVDEIIEDEIMEDAEFVDEDDEDEVDPNDPFKPTTIVLAKVKGYPAWPAMVLKESLLPDNIKRKKPKPSTKKKPVRSLPVRFFSDDTYIWMNELDIKHLTDDMIQEYFNVASKKRRRDNLLEQAYQLAIDPPDMGLFVLYGSRAEPPEEQELDQLLAPIVDPEEVKQPSKKRGRKANPSSVTNLRQMKKQENLKQIEERKKLEARLLAEYDDDWGLEGIDGYDKEAGDYIFDTPDEQKLLRIHSEDLAINLHEFQDKFAAINEKLTNMLLINNDIDEAGTMKQLGNLEKLINDEAFPKTILIKSKLLRLLILTYRKPIETFPYSTIKDKIAKILQHSLNLTVRMTTLDDLKEEEKEEEKKEDVKQEENELNGEKSEPNGKPNGELNGEHVHSNGQKV